MFEGSMDLSFKLQNRRLFDQLIMKYVIILSFGIILVILDTIFIRFSKNKKPKALSSTSVLLITVLLASYELFWS